MIAGQRDPDGLRPQLPDNVARTGVAPQGTQMGPDVRSEDDRMAGFAGRCGRAPDFRVCVQVDSVKDAAQIRPRQAGPLGVLAQAGDVKPVHAPQFRPVIGAQTQAALLGCPRGINTGHSQSVAVDPHIRMTFQRLVDLHFAFIGQQGACLLYTSPSPRDS